MSDESPTDEIVYSEDAIEEAYQMALRASEEAGMLPPVIDESAEAVDAGPTEATVTDDPQGATEPADEPNSEKEKPSRGPKFQPEQIIEALLFVGGEKLTAKKMAGFIGHNCPDDRIREYVDTINTRYRQQNRPYEVQLGEEGYRMSLKSEFQKQKHLLYGLGPREVKLSQDALEVLSLIAFEQPVTQEKLEELDRRNTKAMLRQLIRRELVVGSKNEQGHLEYHTTERFLNLFGLESLSDLPRTPDLNFK